MAKLLSYYRLCPLIDTKHLLGITEDQEKGIVIVTLGKNIAIKYRLSDQKQICSWRSKEKFTSPVYFDKKLEKYVAVFSNSFIRTWTDEDDSLDKVKKYKVNSLVHTIIKHGDGTFLLFQSGSVYPLGEVLDDRKTFTASNIIEVGNIGDLVHLSMDDDLYVGFLVKGEETIFYWTCYTYYSKNSFSTIKFPISDTQIQGLTLSSNNKKVELLTVWSDGKILSKNLISQEKDTYVGELFTVLEKISSSHPVKLCQLDDNHLAIYGSDPNEEGAVLLIYNLQFKVCQSKQNHKLYSAEAKLWRGFNSILLPIGQNLMVVPFSLQSEQLVQLIGSHKQAQGKIDNDISIISDFEVADWEKENKKMKKKAKGKQCPDALKEKIEEFHNDGLPESLIIEQILPEFIETCNLELIEQCLQYFADVPEKYLAQILQFILQCKNKKFPKSAEKYENLPTKLSSNKRITLIDKILTIKFSDVLLLPYLKSHLSIDNALLLLEYITYQLSENGHNLPGIQEASTEKTLFRWLSIVIDSNYQKFILSKDEEIEQVLKKCQEAVLGQLDLLNDLQTVVPVLSKFQAEVQGKNYGSGYVANRMYSIEQIVFKF